MSLLWLTCGKKDIGNCLSGNSPTNEKPALAIKSHSYLYFAVIGDEIAVVKDI